MRSIAKFSNCRVEMPKSFFASVRLMKIGGESSGNLLGNALSMLVSIKIKKGTEALLPLYPQHKMFEMEK